MPATYEPIQSTMLSSSSSSVTLSSIPGTFTDLVLVVRAFAVTADDRSIAWRANSDSGTNYSETSLYGITAGAGSERYSSGTSGRLGRAISFLGTGGSIVVAHFMSYSNTNVFKTVLIASANASATSSPGVERSVDLYRSTSAITSIEVIAGSPNSFASGSTFSLYGIKAA